MHWADWKKSNDDEWNTHLIAQNTDVYTNTCTCTHTHIYAHSYYFRLCSLSICLNGEKYNSWMWFCHISSNSYIEVLWSEKKETFIFLSSSSSKGDESMKYIHTSYFVYCCAFASRTNQPITQKSPEKEKRECVRKKLDQPGNLWKQIEVIRRVNSEIIHFSFIAASLSLVSSSVSVLPVWRVCMLTVCIFCKFNWW